MNSELPIHVDGEPWIQCAGEIVVLKSALKVTIKHFLILYFRFPEFFGTFPSSKKHHAYRIKLIF